MTEREFKMRVEESAELVAKILSKGKDVEIRKSRTGISVSEISKKVLKR